MQTFYELFSGIDGFTLGMQRAGFECVGHCEIDDDARKIHKKNFGSEPEASNVIHLDAGAMPDFDILTAGFPCQPFSYAGQRLGLDEPRGNLFFEIVRIARQKRPKILFLENVEGLLNNDNYRTFIRMLFVLDELGYDPEWQVIDGGYYLPQHRQRIFIVGHLRERPVRKVFPIIPPVKESPRARTVKLILLAHTKANIQQRMQDRTHAWTLDTSSSKFGIVEGERVRILTPLERERIMGFPDGWTEGVPEKARYRLLGNAVMPQVVEHIAKQFR